MQDGVIRAFSRAHRLSEQVLEQLAASVQRLVQETPESARGELPGLVAELVRAAIPAAAPERDALAAGDTETGTKLSARDTVAMDAPPATELMASPLTAAGAGRLERLWTTIGAPIEPRYADLGFLGQGGMGEVRRVHDHDLGRTLAMKIIGDGVKTQASAQAKFVAEARICAGLQHPGIVPIYELGRLPDGRFYFTMQEIAGHNLGVQIRQFHALPRAQFGAASGDSPGLRRLIDVFHRVCEAVAYAHARGVVHRDLKPDNVMLGREGQVLVVDWGIARSFAPLERADEAADVDAPIAGEQRGATRLGGVVGTPAYMAPEQILGQSHLIDARTDVYALGMILYEILAGAPPGASDGGVMALLRRTQAEVRPLGEVVTGNALPETLVDICHRALRRAPEQRFQDAGALAVAVGDWLEGVRQREHALALVGDAAALDERAAALQREAAALREQATASLRQIAPWAGEQIKRPHWEELQTAERLGYQATQCRLESEQRLHTALTFAPGLPEADQALALRYAADHAEAEADKRDADSARAEFHLRAHCTALPADSPVRARLTAYLRAEGQLSLVTEPANAVVHVHPFVTRDRRLQQAPALGPPIRAPLTGWALPVGSYVLRVEAPGRETVLVPVTIQRGQRWTMTPPGEHAPLPLWLPPAGSIRADEVYVPAGWFRAGGDPAALNALPECRLWLEEFVIRREPVTNREYLEFLNDLVARGAEAEARRHVPTDLKPLSPVPLYRRGLAGRYVCDDAVLLDWPVVYIDWASARRFCRWLAARDERPWRLPDELEWEKAARGVDGRLYPWGDFLDPSWCWTRDSHPHTPSLAVSGAHPVDCSPYGVLGMAGNSMDWCANPFVAPEQFDTRPRRVAPYVPDATDDRSTVARLYRGGSWCYNAQLCRPVRRFRHQPDTRVNDLGVRPVRGLDRPSSSA